MFQRHISWQGFDKTDMKYQIYIIICALVELTNLRSFAVSRMQNSRHRVHLPSTSYLNSSQLKDEIIVLIQRKSKKNFKCQNLLLTDKIYLLFQTRMKMPLALRSFVLNSDWNIFSKEILKVQNYKYKQVLKVSQWCILGFDSFECYISVFHASIQNKLLTGYSLYRGLRK